MTNTDAEICPSSCRLHSLHIYSTDIAIGVARLGTRSVKEATNAQLIDDSACSKSSDQAQQVENRRAVAKVQKLGVESDQLLRLPAAQMAKAFLLTLMIRLFVNKPIQRVRKKSALWLLKKE